MKPKLIALFSLALLIAVQVLVVLPVSADEYSEQEANLREVKEAQKKARELLTDLSKTESDLMAEIRQLNQNLTKAQQELAAVEQDLQRTKESIQEVRKDIKEADAAYGKSQREMQAILEDYNQRLREIYMSGGADIFDLILGTSDPDDFALRMKLFAALLEEDVSLYEEVRASRNQLEADRKALDGKYQDLQEQEARLTALKNTAAKRVAEVKKAKEARDNRLKAILSQKQNQQQVLNELAETSRKLEAWLKEHETPALPQDETGKVRFQLPITGKIVAEFGWRVHPVDQVQRFHEGLDFAAAVGTPFQAAAAGKVALSGWVGGYGYTIIIEHSDGFSTVYAHASALHVNVGDLVKAGQTIGEVGNTGLSAEPSLHFEIRRSGHAVDPKEYLPE